MNSKKGLLIISEKSERVFVRRRSKRSHKAFCKNCGAEIEWKTIEEILKIAERGAEDAPEKNRDETKG